MANSNLWFTRAQKVTPGGVNSPVRAFKAVGGEPIFIDHAMGAYLFDVDGRRYIDYVGSWGPMILGHNHASVREAVNRAVDKGLSFGAPTTLEVELAEKITELMPSIQQVRMVNSGTEAVMSAIRLARGFTGRDNIIKFEGGYHGHADTLLVQAGSGALTFGEPSSPGVPADLIKHTFIAHYNDIDSVQRCFEQHPNSIAALIVEPVAGNMNCVLPNPGFLQQLRALCDHYKCLLIFDEVMTGFRVALGGAQAYYDVKPDLTTLGKVIGGGLPVGAFGGRAEVMQMLAPQGPVYQAGTLSGNPVAMAAGLATLELVARPDFFTELSAKTEQLTQGLQLQAHRCGVSLTTNAVGGMFGIFFSEQPVQDYAAVSACDRLRFNQFFHGMLQAGVYLAPSAFEAGFMSQAHTVEDIEQTLEMARSVLSELNA